MKKRGRPLLYQTEEERKAAIRRIHQCNERNKWYCEVCQREYSLGSKTNHTNTKKHQRNYYANQPLVEI